MDPIQYNRQTTLITGASSGIGEAFARALAVRGSNLVLVARRADRLDALAQDIRSRCAGVEVQTLPSDLAIEGASTRIREELDRRRVAVSGLVNNAGFGTWGLFADSDPENLQQMIRLNISAVVDLSHTFLDQIIGANGGFLLNVTSVAAYASIPNQGTYSATKAFVLSFTESLWAEIQKTESNTRVLAFAPGVTDTEYYEVVGTRDADAGSRYQSPALVAENALVALNRRNPPPSAISGWRNMLYTLPSRFLTRRLTVSATARVTLAKVGIPDRTTARR